MTGDYDLQLVVLSMIVAIMASYTALELAGRVSQKQGTSSWSWLVGGAVSMGTGIWSMHFIGMLAFKLPVAVAYDAAATMLSMAIAIVVSGLALFVVRRPTLSAKNLAAGAMLMGVGISAMHYTGMQAMRMSPPIEYHPPLFIASVLIAIVASLAALWIAFQLRHKHSGVALLAKLGSATIMGLAITGMHYTGMAAAQFAPDAICLAVDSTGGMKSGVLALTVGIATICILVLTQAAISLENALLYTDLRQENNDRKRAEEVLREQANLLDLTHDTVFVRDMNNVITYWNRGAEERYGWTRQEAVGRVAHQLLQAVFPEPLEEINAELLRVDHWEGELIHTRRDGIPVVVASRWALQRDQLRKPAAILETNNDITERKQAAAEREARRAAELANQAKSAFLARMSHELRTPLTGILGYAEILRGDRTLTERQLHGVGVIRQSGEHLLTLINDILDFARIEAGKLELSVTEIPTARFLYVIADIIRIRAEEKQLAFRCDFAPDLPPAVLADERRLRQVLLNLLANAVKFTDRGVVSLRVSFSPPRRLRFEVRDTGIGISEDRWETIFQPFEQVGDMHHRVGGTGLGLAITRQLVRLMGSDIELESRASEGSAFCFDLEVPVVPQPRTAPASAESVVTGYVGPRRKVLVVDDVAANRMLLGDMLGPLGFELAEAADGREGVKTAASLRPDLILMDTAMPETDGLQATRLLRQLPGLGEVAIIAISANASGSNEAIALAAGADAFLPKPIDLSGLLAQICHLLQLQWTCELRESGPAPRHGGPAPLVAPPAQELAVLHHLALLGNMRDIAQHAAHLSELDGRYGAFADQLKLLAKGYQSKAILRLVEQHLNARAPATGEYLPLSPAPGRAGAA